MNENKPTRVKIICGECRNEIICFNTVKFGSGLLSATVDIESSTKPFCKTCGPTMTKYRNGLVKAVADFAASTMKEAPDG